MVQMLTVEKITELTGLGRSTIYKHLASGALESVKIGGARRIPVDALEAFIRQARTEQGNRLTA